MDYIFFKKKRREIRKRKKKIVNNYNLQNFINSKEYLELQKFLPDIELTDIEKKND